jgi:predicted metalloprotease with PDZ domain
MLDMIAGLPLRVAAAFLILVAALPVRADTGAPPPALDLTIAPRMADEGLDRVGVRMRIESPGLSAGDVLVRMPRLIVSMPGARLAGDGIEAHDRAGPLELIEEEEEATPTAAYRRWLAARDTVGDVTIRYEALPREVSPTTRQGPLFDLRAQPGGFNGAGITFIAVPPTEHPYRIRLSWDLSAMPPGSRGVWSLGDGDVQTVGPSQMIAFSYYAAGLLDTYPGGGSDFSMYWFGEPPFEADALAAQITRFFEEAARFFRDPDPNYRVFARENPFAGTGGTALARSFMFGYNQSEAPTPESLQGLLAHEITHNWPRLQGEHGDTAWYSEGTAEYYSILLSLRAGLIDLEGFEERVNARAQGYYSNPLQSLSNAEAARRFWTDNRAQRVPYGRGFMYLALVDARLRERSGGAVSLDDIVVELVERARRGEPHGNEAWLELIRPHLGEAADLDYRSMVEGRKLVPSPGSFGPCFRTELARYNAFELGFEDASLHEDRMRITGLVPGSQAERAGLEEGDRLLSATPVFMLMREPDLAMTLVVEREGNPVEISYLPRGEAVEGIRWSRNEGSEEARCTL